MRGAKRSEKSMGSRPRVRSTERSFPPLERKRTKIPCRAREREREKWITESERKESKRSESLGKVKNY